MDPTTYMPIVPIPMAAWSEALVSGSSLVGTAGSNPLRAWMSVVSVLYYQVEVSASGRSLDQRSRTECCVSLSVIMKYRH